MHGGDRKKIYPQYLGKSERRRRWGFHRVDGRITLGCILKL